VGGRDVVRERRAARRQIGYLPERAPAYPELRACEYLHFRARLKGIPRRRRRTAVDCVIEACALSDVVRRITGQLSRGYRQRLGLADALLGDPPLLILDEPTVGLDPNQNREVRALIRRLAGEHTVLLSSHVLSDVEALCSRVLVLQRGRVVGQGPIDDLREERGVQAVDVRARGPVEELLGVLRGLPGVQGVEVLGRGEAPRLRVRGAANAAGREAIAAAVIGGGWGLQELRCAGPSLEEVFAQLTEAGQVNPQNSEAQAAQRPSNASRGERGQRGEGGA
jgi:ABC-2 type transport system ATP-binding protein